MSQLYWGIPAYGLGEEVDHNIVPSFPYQKRYEFDRETDQEVSWCVWIVKKSPNPPEHCFRRVCLPTLTQDAVLRFRHEDLETPTGINLWLHLIQHFAGFVKPVEVGKCVRLRSEKISVIRFKL